MVLTKAFEPPNLAIATLAGVVTSSDQAEVIAWIRRSIRAVGSIRLLLVLELFGGWQPPASFDDATMWLRDDEGVSMIAIVGAPAWRHAVMTLLGQPLRSIPIAYFNSESAARRWLDGEPAIGKNVMAT